MDSQRRPLHKALLVVGLLNLVLLGAVACGDPATPGASSDELTARLIRLEAWRAGQDSMERSRTEWARSVDKSLTKQAEAMRLLNQVLQDVLAKIK